MKKYILTFFTCVFLLSLTANIFASQLKGNEALINLILLKAAKDNSGDAALYNRYQFNRALQFLEKEDEFNQSLLLSLNADKSSSKVFSSDSCKVLSNLGSEMELKQPQLPTKFYTKLLSLHILIITDTVETIELSPGFNVKPVSAYHLFEKQKSQYLINPEVYNVKKTKILFEDLDSFINLAQQAIKNSCGLSLLN